MAEQVFPNNSQVVLSDNTKQTQCAGIIKAQGEELQHPQRYLNYK